MHDAPGNGLLSVGIEDAGVLHAAYMPFIINGGLFIPTNDGYRLGDEVFLLLRLMDEADSIPVAGKVVWITPDGARNGRTAGIGVQFNDRDDVARQRIEGYLAELGAALGERDTYTM